MAVVPIVLGTLYTPLNAVSVTGVSASAWDYGSSSPGRAVTFEWFNGGTASPTGCQWQIEASLDGTTYVPAVAGLTSLIGLQTFSLPGRYFRVNLLSLTGGTAPTFTVQAQT